MELRVLQYFLAIAKEESISKAANYLHISQSKRWKNSLAPCCLFVAAVRSP